MIVLHGEPYGTSALKKISVCPKTLNVKLIPVLDFDPYEGVVNFDSLEADLAGYFKWIGDNVREIIEQQQEQALLTNNQELANSLQFTEVRNQVSQSILDLSATFEETITVAIVPLNGRLVAIADAITALSAGDGFDLNTARFRMTALSGPDGYSRIGAETRYSNTDTLDWRGAAWYLDTPNDPDEPTRFLVKADQFIVVSSDDEEAEQPLVFEGGELKLQVANIGLVRAGRLESGSGASYFDLNTGAFRISTS